MDKKITYTNKMSKTDLYNYIIRCTAFGIEPVIDGWVYDVYNDLPCVIGFDDTVYEEYSEKYNLDFYNCCDDIIFDFDKINNCLQSRRKNRFRKIDLVVCKFTIYDLLEFKSIGQLNFVDRLNLPDTKRLAENSLLNATIGVLDADNVVELGKKCLCGCNNLQVLSLKSIKDIKLSDIENFRCLIHLYKLYLDPNAKIVDENYYTLRNGRNVVFEFLDLSNVNKISSDILIHLMESGRYGRYGDIELPNLEEIVMYNNALNLNHYLYRNNIYLDNLKSLDSDLFYNISAMQETISLKSLTHLKEKSFNAVKIGTLYLNNVKTISESAFYNCRIKELHLESLEVLDLNQFLASEVKDLYINKNCKIIRRKGKPYKTFEGVFNEIHRV